MARKKGGGKYESKITNGKTYKQRLIEKMQTDPDYKDYYANVETLKKEFIT